MKQLQCTLKIKASITHLSFLLLITLLLIFQRKGLNKTIFHQGTPLNQNLRVLVLNKSVKKILGQSEGGAYHFGGLRNFLIFFL